MKKVNKELRKAVRQLAWYVPKDEIKKGIPKFFSCCSPYLISLGVVGDDYLDHQFRESFGADLHWSLLFKGFDVKDVYEELADAYYHCESYFSGILLKSQCRTIEKGWTHIFELTISPKTIADFAEFPEERGFGSIGIEIKTDLDSLKRLDHQLTDYYKLFDTVWVLTTESKAEKVSEIIEKNAIEHPTCNQQRSGILILKGKKIKMFKSGSSKYIVQDDSMDKNKEEHWKALFDLLTKKDLLRIVPKEIDGRKWAFRSLCFEWLKNHMGIDDFRCLVYRTIASKYKRQSDLAVEESKLGHFVFCQPVFKTAWHDFDLKFKRKE